MQYQGGKFQIAKPLCAFLERMRDPGQLFVEPFLGGCNIFPRMRLPKLGSDVLPDLALLYRAVRDGWDPPEEVSEELWRELKHAEPSALRAFAGFACSFGGKWFGGYASVRKSGQHYARNGRNRLLADRAGLQRADIHCATYDELDIPDGALVYCDPPYAGTCGYLATVDFDHGRFWAWVEALGPRAYVYVSEYSAPEGFEEAWSIDRLMRMRRHGPCETRTERLFTCGLGLERAIARAMQQRMLWGRGLDLG